MKSEKFLILKPEIAATLKTIKGKITREIAKENHDLKPQLHKITAALNEINEDLKDPGLLQSHIYPIITFLGTAGKILKLADIPDLIRRIRQSFSQSADDPQADVRTALLKLAPEIIAIIHNLQTALDLKKTDKKFQKTGKKSTLSQEQAFENRYMMSILAEQACEEWELTCLNFESLCERSSRIFNFFLHALSDLYVKHPNSDSLFKLETRLFTVIDDIYKLLGKPLTLYPSQLRSKYFQALYFFSQKTIDIQAAILALKNVLPSIRKNSCVRHSVFKL
jgi:hypothetical protein